MDTELSITYLAFEGDQLADDMYFVDDGIAEERPDVEITQRDARGVRMAQGMGWFSIGLGLTQLLAPHLFNRIVGVRNGSGVLTRLLGARELVSGLALLGGRDPVRALDARIAGDVMDLGLLAANLVAPANGRGRLVASTISVLGATGMDIVARRHLAADPQRQERVAQVTRIGKSITIDAAPHAVYQVWRTFERAPEIFPHLVKVERLDAIRSRWTARGPAGTTLSWEAEIVDDRPGELIVWNTIGGPLETSGIVRFLTAPGGRGCEVVVEMDYHVFGGGLGRAAATALGLEPGIELERGLRRLKQIFEIGEPMRSDAKKGDR